MPSQLTQEGINCLDRDGYFSILSFLSPQEVGELLVELDRYAREIAPTLSSKEVYYDVKGKPETLQRLNRMNKFDAYFDQMLRSDEFMGMAERMLGVPVVPEHISYFTKPAQVGILTPPHQDAYYWLLKPPVGVTYWLALDPVDEQNGCIRYVKGSHLGPMRSHGDSEVLGFSQTVTDYGDKDRQQEVAFCAEPGDMLVHHGMTIHRADANTSDRNRRAIGLVYFDAAATRDNARAEAGTKVLHEKLARQGKI